jgi:hypothetical protein
LIKKAVLVNAIKNVDADKAKKALDLIFSSYGEVTWIMVETGKRHAEEIADVVLAVQGTVKAVEVLSNELSKDAEAKKMFDDFGDLMEKRGEVCKKLLDESVDSLVALFKRPKVASTDPSQEELPL